MFIIQYFEWHQNFEPILNQHHQEYVLDPRAKLKYILKLR
jgi:hypothetical protein